LLLCEEPGGERAEGEALGMSAVALLVGVGDALIVLDRRESFLVNGIGSG